MDCRDEHRNMLIHDAHLTARTTGRSRIQLCNINDIVDKTGEMFEDKERINKQIYILDKLKQ